MEEFPVALGSVISGRYRVDAVIGAGSMGVVCAGYNLDLDQPVAIKFLSVTALATTEAMARFRREVRAAARIKSEHVARVFDVGALDTGLPYMVMEYLEGHDLEHELALYGPLSVEQAVDYVLQAIEPIAEAHAASVVHRDLKPANLFLALRADRTRIVKVLDFGISKTIGDAANAAEVGLTRTGMIVGSPLYMAPEQLGSSRALDCRVDIWALGGILFQLVTGRTAYAAASAAELYAMLLRDRPAPLSHHRAGLPAEFEAIVLRCLEREPSERFENVSALADALVPFAPASARIHAERARGVLHVASTSRPAPTSLSPASSFSSAPPLVSSSQRASQRPRASTNGETTASWGKEASTMDRRKRQRAVFAALVATLATVFGVELWLGRRAPAPAVREARSQPSPIGAALAPPSTLPAPPGSATADAERPEPSAAPSSSAKIPQVTAARTRAPVRATGETTKPLARTDSRNASPDGVSNFGPRK